MAFYADDTDLVQEGQLLVQLDPTIYQVNFDKTLASLASTVLEVRKLYDTVPVNQAIVENKHAALETANYDYRQPLPPGRLKSDLQRRFHPLQRHFSDRPIRPGASMNRNCKYPAMLQAIHHLNSILTSKNKKETSARPTTT